MTTGETIFNIYVSLLSPIWAIVMRSFPEPPRLHKHRNGYQHIYPIYLNYINIHIVLNVLRKIIYGMHL